MLGKNGFLYDLNWKRRWKLGDCWSWVAGEELCRLWLNPGFCEIIAQQTIKMTISSCAFYKLIFYTARYLIRISGLGRNSFFWRCLKTKTFQNTCWASVYWSLASVTQFWKSALLKNYCYEFRFYWSAAFCW